MKRRALRIFLIALAVVGFTAYFAFSTFLFSPLEGAYEYDVSTLVPRQVDFFVAKGELRRDFGDFPRLRAADALETSKPGQAFLASSLYRETVQPALQELEVSLEGLRSQLPIRVDVLDVFGGRDLALAGSFQGAELADARWAAYARTNWMGKLALALLDYPGLLGLEAQGLSAVEADGVITLSGGQLTAPVHLTRVRDVLIVGSDGELVRAAHELVAKTGADSFGQSARYADYIDHGGRDGDELEFFVDYLALSEELRLTGRWPDAQSQEFTPAFFGRLFQTAALKELVGTGSFRDGVSLDLRGEFSSELVTPVQKKLYRTRHFDKDRFRNEVAKFAPLDASFFAYLHADIGDLMRQALDALDSSTLGLVEDQVRAVWGYGTADTLVEDVEKAFHNRLAVVVRPNDYPYDPQGPPHNDDPVPAWGLVLWTDDRGKLEEIRQTVVNNQSQFGLQGRQPGESGIYHNDGIAGGWRVYEYWSQQIPGTGHFASVTAADFFIFSNSFRLVEQMLKTYFEGHLNPAYQSLTDNPVFQKLAARGIPAGTLMVWTNPGSLGGTLRDMLRRLAEQSVVIDQRMERARLEALVLKSEFSGRSVSQLDTDETATLNDLVDQRMRQLIDDVRAEQVPALFSRYDRAVTMSEIVGGAVLQLALQPKSFELALRALTARP